MAMQLNGIYYPSPLSLDALCDLTSDTPMDDVEVLSIMRSHGAADPRLDHVPAEQWERVYNAIEWVETLNKLDIYAISAAQSMKARQQGTHVA